MKEFLTVVILILMFGCLGRIEYSDSLTSSIQDELNRTEYLKDLQVQCMSDRFSNEYCKVLKLYKRV